MNGFFKFPNLPDVKLLFVYFYRLSVGPAGLLADWLTSKLATGEL